MESLWWLVNHRAVFHWFRAHCNNHSCDENEVQSSLEQERGQYHNPWIVLLSYDDKSDGSWWWWHLQGHHHHDFTYYGNQRRSRLPARMIIIIITCTNKMVTITIIIIIIITTCQDDYKCNRHHHHHHHHNHHHQHRHYYVCTCQDDMKNARFLLFAHCVGSCKRLKSSWDLVDILNIAKHNQIRPNITKHNQTQENTYTYKILIKTEESAIPYIPYHVCIPYHICAIYTI